MEADYCASLQRECTSSSASSGCIRGRRGFGGRGVVQSTFSEQIPAFPWINPALTDEEQRCLEQSWQTIVRFNPNLRDTLDRPGIYRPPQAALTDPLVTQPQLPTSIPSIKKSSKKKITKQHHLQSRTACCNCHEYVSTTSRRLRTTDRIACRKCYPLVKKLEASEKKILADEQKIKKLRRNLKTAHQKLKRSRATIEVIFIFFIILQ